VAVGEHLADGIVGLEQRFIAGLPPDATLDAQKLLSCVYRLRGDMGFGIAHVGDGFAAAVSWAPDDVEAATWTAYGGTGTLALGAVQADGTQQVIYTAPTSVGTSTLDAVSYTVADQHKDAVAKASASVQLDAGPSIIPVAPSQVAQGQTVTITNVSPGLSGDTLTIVGVRNL